jgi:PIN domain nuclease of toxin-antitoxin system
MILDTCALIELCKPAPSFSAACLEKMEEGAEILSVSFAEIALKIKQGKLALNLTAEELYERYLEVPSVAILDVSCRHWLDSVDLDWDHRDPADRLIVAHALRTGRPVVTTDRRIKAFYKNVVW